MMTAPPQPRAAAAIDVDTPSTAKRPNFGDFLGHNMRLVCIVATNQTVLPACPRCARLRFVNAADIVHEGSLLLVDSHVTHIHM
jgi:hypothetical protein